MNTPSDLPIDPRRRKALLALLALPAGCTFQPLGPVRTEPLAAPAEPPGVRPPALGQSWTYRKLNGYNSELVAIEQHQVTALTPRIVISIRTDSQAVLPDEQQQPWGQVLRDPSWDRVQNYEQALPIWPPTLELGAIHAIRTHYRLDHGSYRYWISVQIVARAWEKIELASGTFRALRIEKFIRQDHFDVARLDTVRKDTVWLVPEIGRWAAREISGEYRFSGRRGPWEREANFRWELAAWT